MGVGGAGDIEQTAPSDTFTVGEYGHPTLLPVAVVTVRGGNIVGEHEVIFGTDSQTITLKHQAHDRALFAEGALTAARFLLDRQPGFYHMDDLLG